MITIKSKKKAILAITAVMLAIAVASTVIYVFPAQAEESLCGKRVEIFARGITKQRIGNETIKMPANMNLTLYLGERHGPFTPITGSQGVIDVDGNVYEITCGGGRIFHRKEQAFVWLTGVDDENQTFTIRLYAEYFWMGGNLYVARSIGVFKTDVDMRLLLRMKAHVFPE